MIDHVASFASVSENTITTIMKSNEYNLFFESVNRGQANKDEFHRLAAFVTRQLHQKTHPSVIYIAGGQYPLFSWHQIDNENQSTSQSPKIDLFTAEIRWDDKAKAAYSDCFGGVSHLVSKKLYPVLTSTPGKDLADNAQKDFAMENIQTLLELRSRTSAINDPKCLENLTLKATELLRHQFYRRFILGFLVAGHNIGVTLFSREGVFVGAPKDFRTTPLLVRCIVATLNWDFRQKAFSPTSVMSRSFLSLSNRRIQARNSILRFSSRPSGRL